MAFNLNNFEYNCYHDKFEDAARELIALLKDLDSDLGELDSKFTANVPTLAITQRINEHFLSRIIAATTYLFLNKDFNLSDNGIYQLIYLQRWIAIIFAASPFRNADHILQGFNNSGEADNFTIPIRLLPKFAVFYLPDSNVPANFDFLWDANNSVAIKLVFALLSPRFLATSSAHEKREILLKWAPTKLKLLDNLKEIPVNILHDVYMHCSYADAPTRHEIKKELNRLMRAELKDYGINDIDYSKYKLEAGTKPVLFVLLEWFNNGHSIYRTHSRTIEESKDKFYIVGMGSENRVGKDCLHVFDEYISIPDNMYIYDQVKMVRDEIEKRKASVFYMPSIGMFLTNIFLTNLDLAPLQIVALGHPATTNSKYVDYVVVEDIYVGKGTDKCFSEELIRLPKDVFYRPSAHAKELTFEKTRPKEPEVVKIVMAATIMKFNPGLLTALRRIIEGAKTKVHFEMLIGQAIGLTHMHVENVISRALGAENVTVHHHLPYNRYMEVMNGCDMFVNPFPFGNTNGIVDTITAGLIGVCKTGPEVFEHIDEGLFRYLGFPEKLICKTVDEYVDQAIALVDNHKERNQLAAAYSGADKVTKLFGGDASCMGKMIYDKLNKFYKENYRPRGKNLNHLDS